MGECDFVTDCVSVTVWGLTLARACHASFLCSSVSAYSLRPYRNDKGGVKPGVYSLRHRLGSVEQEEYTGQSNLLQLEFNCCFRSLYT